MMMVSMVSPHGMTCDGDGKARLNAICFSWVYYLRSFGVIVAKAIDYSMFLLSCYHWAAGSMMS